MKKFDGWGVELKFRKPMLRTSRECRIVLLPDDECGTTRHSAEHKG